MGAILENVTGLVSHAELDPFLRGAAATFGDLWDVDQIVAEVVAMADSRVGPDSLVRVTVAAYPERRLLVRLDRSTDGLPVQEWEYLATP